MDVEPAAEDAPRCWLGAAAKDRSSWPPAAAMPALKWSDARRGPRSCTARDLLELEESRMTAPLMRRCPSMVPTRPAAEGEVLDSLRRSLSGEDDMPRARLRRCPPAGSPTLRAVVSLFRGRFPTHRGTSRQTVRLSPEQYGHRGHEPRGPLTRACMARSRRTLD